MKQNSWIKLSLVFIYAENYYVDRFNTYINIIDLKLEWESLLREFCETS